ncbi:hypothetical protein [Aquimarina litoralis]|uniref:hypothetical protein n=1 Tax=Aquimarina litoralis TaxID=584605 RepID=UPI001C55DBD3|nr:hypothetical protein [Aquimarina litoralis]
MLNNISTLGIELTKDQQKEIKGSGRIPELCCNPLLTCCSPNRNFNGSNCMFVPGGACA